MLIVDIWWQWRMREPSPVELALKEIALRTDAVAIAFYETGRTLVPDPIPQVQDENWTGQIYLVAAWADVADIWRTGQLEGFTAAIMARGRQPLLDVLLDAKATRLVGDPSDLPELFRSEAVKALNAQAALIVSASFNYRFPSAAILYFDTPRSARNQYDLFRMVEEADSVDYGGVVQVTNETGLQREVHQALLRLRANLMHQAQSRHFDFLTRFQIDNLDTLRAPSLANQAEAFEKQMQRSVEDLAEHLHCPDVRVYLIEHPAPSHLGEGEGVDNPAPARQRFRLAWRSWPDAPAAGVPSDDAGPIGWSLSNLQPIYIHNRATLSGFPKAMGVVYPGLEDVESYGDDGSGVPVPLLYCQPPPPTPLGRPEALLVHPIVIFGRAIGAIVCNGRTRSPYVFHEWDDTSLAMIALAIGGTWMNVEHRKQATQDRMMLQRAATEVRAFSRKIEEWLSAEEPEEGEVYDYALKTADRIVNLKEPFSSIRLYDAQRKQFAFAYHSGDRWNKKANSDRFASRVFPVNQGKPTSVAAYVYRSKQPAEVFVKDPPPWFLNTFEIETKRGLYVPIFRPGSTSEISGIMDIRTLDDAPFPRSASAVLMMLTDMIGLTMTLLQDHRNLREVNKLLRAAQGREIEIFEDLAHQVSSPLRNTLDQLGRLSRYVDVLKAAAGPAAKGHLDLARVTVRRAMRVSLAARYFRELRETGRIAPDRNAAPIQLNRLQERMQTLMNDYALLQRPDQKLSFNFDSGSVRRAYENDIVGDLVLFEQIIANLLENALKYSLPDTMISLRCSRTGDRSRFVVEVSNYGLAIPPADRAKLTQRGYRHPDAILRVPEGQGIGLWMVDHIARAFDGALEIKPGSGRSEPHRFRVIFARRDRNATP